MSKGEFNSVTQVKGSENMADTVYFSKIEYCEVIGYGTQQVRFLVYMHKICKLKRLQSESGYEFCSYFFFERDGMEREDI